MSQITVFYLTHCPYCQNAKKAVEALQMETPAYQSIQLEWVEESQQPKKAEQYDYYYVPSLFSGKEKLYEAHPGQGYEEIKQHIEKAFQAAIR